MLCGAVSSKRQLCEAMETTMVASGCLRFRNLKKAKCLQPGQGQSSSSKKKAAAVSFYMPVLPEHPAPSNKENQAPSKRQRRSSNANGTYESHSVSQVSSSSLEHSSKWTSEETLMTSRLSGLGIRGQLKLALTVNNGLLTIHVMQAKQLKPKSGKTCRAFVKLCLLPEDGNSSTCRTEVSFDTNTPIFDEKFTYELFGDDRHKRLSISVWNKTEHSEELLGCLSFGVKHLLYKNQPVSGWYYLLGEKIGQKKHLKVGQEARSLSIPEVNKNLTGLESIMITLQKESKGFGFTVKGASPVHVAKLEKDSSAERAGICVGDFIVRVNGTNVSRSTAVSVAKLISASAQQLLLEVQRSRSVSRSGSLSSMTSTWVEDKEKRVSPAQESCNNSDQHFSGHYVNLDYSFMSYKSTVRNVSLATGSSEEGLNNSWDTTGRHADWQPKRSGSVDGESDHDHRSLEQEYQNATKQSSILSQKSNGSSAHKSSSSSHKSAKSSSKSSKSQKLSRAVHSAKAIQDFVLDTDSIMYVPDEMDVKIDSDMLNSTICDSSAGPLAEDVNCTLLATPEKDHLQTPFSAQLSSYYYDSPSIFYKDIQTHIKPANSDMGCVRALEAMLRCEGEYVQRMQCGAQRFSRPLRHGLLSAPEHAQLFQNVEKLVAISEFHLVEVQDHIANVTLSQEDEAVLFELCDVGSVYLPRLSLLCDAYQLYREGLPKALDQLDQLTSRPHFRQFLENPCADHGSLGIVDFLRSPLEHVASLLSHFETLVGCVPRHTEAYMNLTKVVKSIKRSQGCGNPIPAPDFSSALDEIDETSMVSGMSCQSTLSIQSSCKSTRSGTSQSSQSAVTVVSADAELLALKKRMIFPTGMKTQNILAPNRHIIFSGELMFVDGWKWAKLWVVLCSDILLLLRLEPNNQLTLVAEPVLLRDITETDFACHHPCEFSLTLSLESQTLVFRSQTVDQKCTWQSLLKHRIAACQNRLEFFL